MLANLQPCFIGYVQNKAKWWILHQHFCQNCQSAKLFSQYCNTSKINYLFTHQQLINMRYQEEDKSNQQDQVLPPVVRTTQAPVRDNN